MNWWARYTAWLHALGLPCFAAVATDCFRAPGRVRLAARGWVVAVAFVALVEARLSTRSIAVDADASPPENVLFPETRGSIMDEVLRSRDAVAVGPMVGQMPSARWKHNVFGALSLPLGARTWIQAADAEVILANVGAGARVRWALWDDGLALPDALRSAATRVEHVPGFYVLALRRD
jgi:hypothetical protein